MSKLNYDRETGSGGWIQNQLELPAALELVGKTLRGWGYPVLARDVNECGIRLISRQPLQESADAIVVLVLENGKELRVRGTIVCVLRSADDAHEAIMVFEEQQPALGRAACEAIRLAA